MTDMERQMKELGSLEQRIIEGVTQATRDAVRDVKKDFVREVFEELLAKQGINTADYLKNQRRFAYLDMVVCAHEDGWKRVRSKVIDLAITAVISCTITFFTFLRLK